MGLGPHIGTATQAPGMPRAFSDSKIYGLIQAYKDMSSALADVQTQISILAGEAGISADALANLLALQSSVSTLQTNVGKGRKILFSQTSDVLIGNTAELLSAFGAGNGSRLLPAGFWTPGKAVIISGNGVFSTRALLPGTFTTRAMHGIIQLATVGITNILAAAADAQFDFIQRVVCKSVTGNNALLQIDGRLNYDVSLTSQNKASMNNGGVAVTVNNSLDSMLDVKLQWSTQDTANKITIKQAFIESVG